MTFEPSAQPPELSAEATPAESPPNAAPPPESAARSTAQQDPSSPATESPTESTPSPPESARPIASSGTGSFNPAAVNPLDWGILAAGFLALVFSFVSYYTATAKSPRLAGTYTASTTAWHGFFGRFAVLVALASAVLLAVHIFLPKGGIPELALRASVLGGFVLASAGAIVAAFVTPDKASATLLRALDIRVDYGRGAGYWLSLIVIVAGAVMAFLRLLESGGSLPWKRSRT